MATLTQTFNRETKKAHDDHYVLNEELHAMDLALEHLGNAFDDTETMAAAKQVQMIAAQLRDELPDHFLHEELGILTTVAEVSPELDYFAREMRRQHQSLLQNLERLRRAMELLETGTETTAALIKVKTLGRAFSKELSRHIAAEEEELRGFL